MKILLDENLPKRLKYEFLETQIFTVRDKGWQGTKNSKLLAKMVEENFDVLITFDKQMRHQQNFDNYPVCVVVLNAQSNSYHSLKHLIPRLKSFLSEPLPRGVIEISTENL